jgi:hypothetical protein
MFGFPVEARQPLGEGVAEVVAYGFGELAHELADGAG